MLSNKPLFTYFLNRVTITIAAVNDLLQDGTLSSYRSSAGELFIIELKTVINTICITLLVD